MSEYQYYEFAAIDRPLTRAEMADLRAASTRAAITPSGFVNHYEWGSLKADPAAWMRRYFDAFVYTAKWCSCRLSLRVPLREAKERAKQEAECRRQREAQLRRLMVDVDKHWEAIDAQAQRGSAAGYQQAVRALSDLAEGDALTSSRKEFERALRRFLIPHATRGALLRRLTKAGLWPQ